MNDKEIKLIIKDTNSEMQHEDNEADGTTELRGQTHTEVFNTLEVTMEWLRWQESVDLVQLLHLKRLRDLAAEKNVLSEAADSRISFYHHNKLFFKYVILCNIV